MGKHDKNGDLHALLADERQTRAGLYAAAVGKVGRGQYGGVIHAFRENERLVLLRRRHHIEGNVLAPERLRHRRVVKFFNQQNTHILFTPFGTDIMKQYCGCFV